MSYIKTSKNLNKSKIPSFSADSSAVDPGPYAARRYYIFSFLIFSNRFCLMLVALLYRQWTRHRCRHRKGTIKIIEINLKLNLKLGTTKKFEFLKTNVERFFFTICEQFSSDKIWEIEVYTVRSPINRHPDFRVFC